MRYDQIVQDVLALINQESIAGEAVSPAYNNQADYLRRLPIFINHALMDIRTTVKPLRATLPLEPEGGEPFGAREVSYTLPDNWWKLVSGGVRVLGPHGGGYRVTNQYRLMGNRSIIVPRGRHYTVEYFCHPEQIPIPVPEGYELLESADVIQMAELYAAAQLVMQEDEFTYSALKEQYEARKALMQPEVTAEVRFADEADFGPCFPFDACPPPPPPCGRISWDGLRIRAMMGVDSTPSVEKTVEGEECDFLLRIPASAGGTPLTRTEGAQIGMSMEITLYEISK